MLSRRTTQIHNIPRSQASHSRHYLHLHNNIFFSPSINTCSNGSVYRTNIDRGADVIILVVLPIIPYDQPVFGSYRWNRKYRCSKLPTKPLLCFAFWLHWIIKGAKIFVLTTYYIFLVCTHFQVLCLSDFFFLSANLSPNCKNSVCVARLIHLAVYASDVCKTMNF